MPEADIQTIENPGDDILAAIGRPLEAYNISQTGAYAHRSVAIVIKDAASGEITGGLWGDSFYDWLFVKLLVVPDALRGTGIGKRLMAAAERAAIEHGCTGIWLDTFEFQARGFYEKLGFTLFGTLADHPRGMSRFFLQKRLDTAPVAPASRSPT